MLSTYIRNCLQKAISPRLYRGRTFQNIRTIIVTISLSIAIVPATNAAGIGNSSIGISKGVVVETFGLTQVSQKLTTGRSAAKIPSKFLPKLIGKKWSTGEYTIEGEGVYEHGRPCFSIEYQVDLKNRTYTLNPIASHYLDDSYLKLQSMDSKTNPDALKAGLNANIAAKEEHACELPTDTEANNAILPQSVASGTYDVTVALRTRDIPNWTITKTSDRLRWYVYNNGTVYWLYWNVSWYAVNPSPISTHWYISQQNHWGPTYGSGNLNVTKSVYGSYYNYDWGWDHLSTNVAQYVSIQGNNNATYTYSWSHSDSGEDSLFIWGVLTFN